MRSLCAVVGLCGLASVGCTSSDEPTRTPALPEQPPPDEPPVLPNAGVTPWDCQPGDIEEADGSCTPPGVIACGQGFVEDGEGGCRAVRPMDACAHGEMAIPGETTCRQVAPCGSGTWGNIQNASVFVDASYLVGDGDGSQLKPFPTLADAVAAASPGAVVAIAAGAYSAVTLDKPVQLWGVCPSMVVIDGGGQVGVRVQESASGSELHDLAVTAQNTAAIRSDGADVLIDRAHLYDSSRGVRAMPPSMPTLGAPLIEVRRSLLEENSRSLDVVSGTLVVEESVVRDGRANANGMGVVVVRNFQDPTLLASLTMRRSVVERMWNRALLIQDTTTILQDTLITDVQVEQVGANTSCAIVYELSADAPVTLTAEGLVVADCDGVGLAVQGVMTADIDNLTVRDVETEGIQGALFASFEDSDGAPVVTLRHASLKGVVGVGIQQGGGSVVAEGVRIEDVLEGPRGAVSLLAINAQALEPRPSLSVNGLFIEHGGNAGVITSGMDVVLHSAWIHDIAPDATGKYGRAVELRATTFRAINTQAALSRVYVDGVHDAGITVLGSHATVVDSEIANVMPAGNGSGGQGMVFEDGAQPSTGWITDTTIRDTHERGLQVVQQFSTELRVERLVVEGTKAAARGYGDGIFVLGNNTLEPPPTLTLIDCISRDNARGGVVSLAATIRMSGGAMVCNPIQLIGESFNGIPYQIADEGSNVCTCGDATEPCRALSSDVAPPTPLDEVEAGEARGGS
jgi:hypothetical protein